LLVHMFLLKTSLIFLSYKSSFFFFSFEFVFICSFAKLSILLYLVFFFVAKGISIYLSRRTFFYTNFFLCCK